VIASQRSDGTFVDVRTDNRTVSFRRPTLEQFQAFQDRIGAQQLGTGFIEFVLACAESRKAARDLFDEWPGATVTVATALVEMITPTIQTKKGRAP
jgi:hypothetical protein